MNMKLNIFLETLNESNDTNKQIKDYIDSLASTIDKSEAANLDYWKDEPGWKNVENLGKKLDPKIESKIFSLFSAAMDHEDEYYDEDGDFVDKDAFINDIKGIVTVLYKKYNIK